MRLGLAWPATTQPNNAGAAPMRRWDIELDAHEGYDLDEDADQYDLDEDSELHRGVQVAINEAMRSKEDDEYEDDDF